MMAGNNFDKLRSMVHQGVPLEETAKEAPKKEKDMPTVDTLPEVSAVAETESETAGNAAVSSEEVTEPAITTSEQIARPTEKRKRKQQTDYQSVFFNRIDFTHRKPLYITATTHRRLMRIVHLMDESKATISSYAENIILNHLETFKEEIDIIYQTNNINPTK